jgi:glutamate synthase (NADPH/NADH) small chain
MAENVQFQTGVEVGKDISAHYSSKDMTVSALQWAQASREIWQLQAAVIENVVFAWDYLAQQKQNLQRRKIEGKIINAKDKSVIVIGGGDTGSDCVGTARRQGAKNICQLEILPKPPETRPNDTPGRTGRELCGLRRRTKKAARECGV